MKRLIGVTAVLVLALLLTACKKDKAVPPPKDCEPATLPRTLDVTADKRWVDAEMYLESGQSIQITASGEADLEDGKYPTTPDGKESCDNSIWGSCTLEGVGWGILLGRIGDGSPFVIGASAQITAEEAGCLSLGINDVYYDDNSGSYSVLIED